MYTVFHMLRRDIIIFTGIYGGSTAAVSYPVHLVIFRLQPAAEACIIEVTTCVIVAVYFVRAIPAVIGEVTELSPRDARPIPTAVRWTIHVSFYRAYRQDS